MKDIYIYNSFRRAGYNVLAMTLDFADLGNPSHRKRVLFFGSQKGLPVFFPERLKCMKHKHIDARDLLYAKLDDVHGRELLPAAMRKLERGDFCREVPPSGASQTVCANHSDHILTLKDGYSLNKLAFPLLQSFPISLFADCTPTQCRRFAGMAVPPTVSRRLAVEFARFLGVMR